MRKLLFLFLLAIPCFAQEGRYDAPVLTNISVSGVSNVSGIGSGATVTVYLWPSSDTTNCATAGSCTLATTYTSHTGGTACNTATQIVLAMTSTCVSTADTNGNFGFWAPPGKIQYCLSGTGISGNPCYNVIVPPDVASMPATTFPTQITSSLSSGTAPFSISSTTSVANLTLTNHPQVYMCGTNSGQVIIGSGGGACNKVQAASPIIVPIGGQLSSGTWTITSLPFTGVNTFSCGVGSASGTTHPIQVVLNSGSSVTVNSAGASDNFWGLCAGY